jgi:hypothetical protein
MAKKVQAKKKQSSSILPILMIGLGAVLFVAFLVWAAINSERNVSSAAQGPYPNIARVTLADAKAALDQKTAVFLDVRDAGSFDAGHIPGALNIPIADVQQRAGELSPSDWIITYCT